MTSYRVVLEDEDCKNCPLCNLATLFCMHPEEARELQPEGSRLPSPDWCPLHGGQTVIVKRSFLEKKNGSSS